MGEWVVVVVVMMGGVVVVYVGVEVWWGRYESCVLAQHSSRGRRHFRGGTCSTCVDVYTHIWAAFLVSPSPPLTSPILKDTKTPTVINYSSHLQHTPQT